MAELGRKKGRKTETKEGIETLTQREEDDGQNYFDSRKKGTESI